MSYIEWFLMVPTCFYLAAALSYAKTGQLGFALAYGCYAMANVGLIIAAIQGR